MFTDGFPAPVRAMLKERRRRRFNRLISAVSTWHGMKVLDVGCGVDGRSFEDFADPSWQITGTDILPMDEVRHSHPNFNYRICDMHDVADKEFDLLVSIGMLEHICPPQDYAAACREMQRVAKQYAIVIPYKWAWIEPHRDRMDYFEDNFRWRSNAEYERDSQDRRSSSCQRSR